MRFQHLSRKAIVGIISLILVGIAGVEAATTNFPHFFSATTVTGSSFLFSTCGGTTANALVPRATPDQSQLGTNPVSGAPEGVIFSCSVGPGDRALNVLNSPAAGLTATAAFCTAATPLIVHTCTNIPLAVSGYTDLILIDISVVSDSNGVNGLCDASQVAPDLSGAPLDLGNGSSTSSIPPPVTVVFPTNTQYNYCAIADPFAGGLRSFSISWASP